MTLEPAQSGGAALEESEEQKRVLGVVVGDQPGPTLVCIGGVHGNEPEGIAALERVFESLSEHPQQLHGEFVGLAGNLPALSKGLRYIDVDLNRRFLYGKANTDAADPTSEDRQRNELARELESIFCRATDGVFVIDLHTTSGNSVPFVVMGDTLANRSFAWNFPIPFTLGLEEHLDGTLSEYLTILGHTSLTIEAGQQNSSAAVDNAEAAIWLGLAAAGLIQEHNAPRVRRSREILARTASSLPRVMEVYYRQPILPDDDFRMEPGFDNFDRIAPGRLLARNRSGEIRSRWYGRLLMPLYQQQGSDGFFVVRELRTEWLALSAVLRRLHIDAIVHWLPGVTRHPTRPETLVVDRRVARWYSVEVLHLLGFRRRRSIGGVLMVSRRRRGGN